MEKLKKFADKINFRIEMDPSFLREKIRTGSSSDNIRPRVDGITENVTKTNPYLHSEYAKICIDENNSVIFAISFSLWSI